MKCSNHPLEPVPVMFLDAHHAPASAGVINTAAGFIPGHGGPVLGDLAIELQAAFAKQPQVVLGLAPIGSFSGCPGFITTGGVSVHAPQPNLRQVCPRDDRGVAHQAGTTGGYCSRIASPRGHALRVSNARFRAATSWQPRYPSVARGIGRSQGRVVNRTRNRRPA